MQFLPFRPCFMNELGTGYVPQLNAPVHRLLATIARVCLSNRDLISLGEHILTRTDDRTVHTFHFKIFWKFSLVYFIWISTYHINRGEAASWLVFRTSDWAVPVRVQDGNKVPLSAQEYKCVPVICYGNLTNCGGSYSILASYIGLVDKCTNVCSSNVLV